MPHIGLLEEGGQRFSEATTADEAEAERAGQSGEVLKGQRRGKSRGPERVGETREPP